MNCLHTGNYYLVMLWPRTPLFFCVVQSNIQSKLCIKYILIDGLINTYNIINTTGTLGLWSSPSVKGSRPPPCTRFSLTVTNEDQAVMFGGRTSSGLSSKAHILHLPTMVNYF